MADKRLHKGLQMKINAHFDQKVIEHTTQMPWSPSPMPGVSRRMLDRIGEEVARATSIVRYDPGSKFSSHVHSGGEEFIVLDGVFQDEHGDFPAGTYVRNPVNTEHTPASEPGCVIFVKLWQFDPSETEILRVDMNSVQLHSDPDRTGVSTGQLFSDSRETVKIEQWEPETEVSLLHPGGMELLVIDGSFTQGDEELTKHAWLRLPKDRPLTIKTGIHGSRVWIKTGHLDYIAAPS